MVCSRTLYTEAQPCCHSYNIQMPPLKLREREREHKNEYLLVSYICSSSNMHERGNIFMSSECICMWICQARAHLILQNVEKCTSNSKSNLNQITKYLWRFQLCFRDEGKKIYGFFSCEDKKMYQHNFQLHKFDKHLKFQNEILMMIMNSHGFFWIWSISILFASNPFVLANASAEK